MNTPTILALFALCIGGLMRFGTQIAGTHKVYAPSFLIVLYIVSTVACIVIQLAQHHPFELSPRMTALASLMGLGFGATMLALLSAFRLGGQGTTIFPISGLAVMVPVALSFIVYHEPVTATKLVGLGLAVSSIIVLSH